MRPCPRPGSLPAVVLGRDKLEAAPETLREPAPLPWACARTVECNDKLPVRRHHVLLGLIHPKDAGNGGQRLCEKLEQALRLE